METIPHNFRIQDSARSSRALRRRAFIASGAAAVGALALGPAFGQALSDKPITIVVGFAAGGIADTIARLTAQNLSQYLKQSVVVENRLGAGGTIAAASVARAPKDGHTLFFASNSHTITPALMKLPFDPIADFAPVSVIAESPMVLVVRQDSPFRNMRELVDAGKKKGNVTYGAVTGTVMHVVTEMLASQVATEWRPIPYKGSAPALMDLIGGQTNFVLDFVQSSMPHIAAGKLRALAVLSRERVAQLPQVPTMAEALLPGFEASGWYGLLAPAGTPESVLQRLNAALSASMKVPEVQEKIKALGSISVMSSREDFFKRLRVDTRQWAEIIAARGIKAD